MGKGKRKRRAVDAGVVTAELRPVERHDFTGGLLGHDVSSWSVGSISEILAVSTDAVFACVSLIADAVSRARWGEWRGNAELPPSRITRRPMQSLTRREWTWLVTATLALYNVCPLQRRGGVDSEGVAYSMVPLFPPDLVHTGRELMYQGVRIDPDSVVYIRRTLWPSVSGSTATMLALARDAFAAASAASAYSADWWENGGAPTTVLTTDQDLDNTQAELLRARWREARANGPSYAAVLGKGATAAPFGADLGAMSAQDATDRLVARIARYFRVPPTSINAPVLPGGLVYQSAEHFGTDLVRYTLEPYSEAIGDVLSEELPGDYLTGRQIRLSLRHLMEAEQLTRYQAWQVATGGKPWMDPDEIREIEGLAPREIAPPAMPAPAEPIETIPEESEA